MTISKLTAGAKGTPGNSNGSDIATAVNALIDASVATYAAVAEVASDLSAITTTDVSEGANQYHTTERSQDAAASLFTGGEHSGLSFAYDDSAAKINATINQSQQFDAIALYGLPQTAGAPAGYGDLAEVVNAGIGAVVKTEQNGTPPAPNFVVYPTANSIDPNTKGSSIWGIGWTTFPNKVGAVSKPTGPDGTNAAEWSDDTGYALATLNDASVAAISGGYDHVCNQIAGVIAGGGHNFIEYNVEGHSLIGGGSYNWIQAGRAQINGGTNNRINGDTYNIINGGFTNKILSGGHNVIAGGEFNTINNTTGKWCYTYGRKNSVTGTSKDSAVIGRAHTVSNDEGSAVIGGQGHDFSGTLKCAAIAGNEVDMTNAQFSGAVGGDDITMTGALYSGSVGGRANVQTGRSSFMAAAEESNDNGARGLFTGRKAQGLGAQFQATIGCNHPTTGVLSQSMVVAQGITTTGSNLNAPTEQMITVGNAGLTTISGSVYVIARNTTDGKTAGYKVDFVGVWDGTNYFLNGVTADLAMTVVYEQASSNITAPTLAFSAGQLRVRFGGTSGKTINWSAVINCIVMRA